jgi:hypothetical protein
MDLAWALMVESIQEANLSNSSNVKFVKVLNNASVAHIVPKTFKTPIIGFTYWPPTFSHLMWIEQFISVGNHHCQSFWKITRSSWSMSFKISSSLEDKWNHHYLKSLKKTFLKAWNENMKQWKQEGKKKEDFFLI